ncbi:MAG: ATP-binding protein, partial [Gammaproteobacteria bacterium]|nr:ATP-binding protein [Gammaproteobacteria bacterium]
MGTGNWNYSIFWKEAIKQIQNSITDQEFQMWFKNMNYIESREVQIIISVPSSFYKDQVTQRYLSLIEGKLLELYGQKIAIEIIIKNINPAAPEEKQQLSKPIRPAAVKRRKHQQLNQEYNFERFVRGENNDFAYMASFAMAKNPGKAYNPCLIYGGVGLGKTHLLQAIGNTVYQDFPELKIVYVTAETFTNEFILAIKENKGHHFKNRYRTVDVLLIDDVHFLPGKVETQEELFHTFNALYDANKQLVFTCDRPVSELKALSDRLRSRFERGLNVDLQPP